MSERDTFDFVGVDVGINALFGSIVGCVTLCCNRCGCGLTCMRCRRGQRVAHGRRWQVRYVTVGGDDHRKKRREGMNHTCLSFQLNDTYLCRCPLLWRRTSAGGGPYPVCVTPVLSRTKPCTRRGRARRRRRRSSRGDAWIQCRANRVCGPERGPWRGGDRPAIRECLRRFCTPS